MNRFPRTSINSRIRKIVISIVLAAVVIVSAVAIFFLIRIRDGSKSTIVEEMENTTSMLVKDKVAIAEKELESYAEYIKEDVLYIESLYKNPEKFVPNYIDKPDTSLKDVYCMQRNLVNKNYHIEDLKKELSLLANIETLWSNMMQLEGNTVSTIYAGTESGFLISYDKYVSMADVDEDGEVYFDHLNRPWYKKAKYEKKVVFTDLSQDYFGRGLTLTCAAPFYNNGEFAGVVAMDILINDLQKEIIDIDLGEGTYAFLVNEMGDIIASPFVDKTATKFENIGGLQSEYLQISSKILSYRSGMLYSNGFYLAYEPINIANWVLCIRIPQELILEPVRAIENIIKRMILIFAAVFLLVAIFSFINVRLFANKLTRPILDLKYDVEEISGGNLDYMARAEGNDEITDLANAFNDMTLSLKNYIRDLTSITAEKERIGAELNVATHIQSSMLPSIFPAFPNDKRFDIYATMDPAKEVGGDFYDFFMIDEKHIAIVVADVSGKGVPAALFMVIGKTLIKDHTGIKTDLSNVFYEVNNLLCESNSENLFITAFEAVINIENGHFTYVNAGHEMPFIYKKGKDWNAYPIKPGFVLAGMENMKFTTGDFYLEPGDKVFQYTDGVTEATNENNELYGMDRLKAALDANADNSVNELLPALKADIDKFVGTAPQFDDITMLGFEFKGM